MKSGLVFLIALTARAAELRVVVEDPSGGRIASALVEVQAADRSTLSARTASDGEAVFDAPTGRVEVKVSAEGFAPRTAWTTVKPSGARVSARLRIAERKDAVDVKVDPREENTNPNGPAFSTALTEQQIANLPDDPEELERTLKEMAGPGATFRVDGFMGARLPHKSQIKSIRFRISPYSADEHDPGFMIVDIQTKPGLGGWRASLGFAYGDDALNARNPFAAVREPRQARRFDATLSGPLRPGRTGSSFWFSRDSSYDSRAGAVVLPEGPASTLIRLPGNATNANARFDHGVGASHVLRGVYEFAERERSNVRDFDLPERRSTAVTRQHALRLSDTGNLNANTIHEFRLQTSWNTAVGSSVSADPALVVQGAFSAGGAAVDTRKRWRDIEAIEHLTFGHGRHAFKAGAQVNHGSYTDSDYSNAAGTFTFPSLGAWNAGRPQQFTRREGNGEIRYRQTTLGLYAMDDIRLARSLSASLGVRYEVQPGVDDRLNLAPRVGIAWSPFRSGRTTVRVGGGIYYQWFDPSLCAETLRLDGLHQSTLVIANPGFPDPFSGGSRGVLPPSVVRQAPFLTMPYTWRVSAGVQQQVGKWLMLMTDVRAQRGVHLWYGRNVNAPVDGARPDPRIGNAIEIASGASSLFNGFMVSLAPAPGAALGKRWFWHANYMFGRARNETDSPLSPPADSYNRRADQGPASTDIRHRFGGMLQYALPLGFQLGSMFRAQSSPPYNITTGLDDNRDTILNDRPRGVGRNSARADGQWYVDARLSWTKKIGTRSEGGAPVARMIRLGGDDRGVPDIGMGTKPGEPQPFLSAQLYTQVFNLFNHTNPTGYAGVLTSPYFGQPTAALAPRRMEIGLKLSF